MKISAKAFISKHCVITGNVEIEENVSIWPMVVIRADVDLIKIGKNSNVQDGSVIHPNVHKPVIIGENVTVGHRAIVHGCKVGNNCLIGMGAIILDGAVIEDNCIISAGAVVAPGKTIPAGSVAMGIPAKPVRQAAKEDLEHISKNSSEYVWLASKTREEKTDF